MLWRGACLYLGTRCSIVSSGIHWNTYMDNDFEFPIIPNILCGEKLIACTRQFISIDQLINKG